MTELDNLTDRVKETKEKHLREKIELEQARDELTRAESRRRDEIEARRRSVQEELDAVLAELNEEEICTDNLLKVQAGYDKDLASKQDEIEAITKEIDSLSVQVCEAEKLEQFAKNNFEEQIQTQTVEIQSLNDTFVKLTQELETKVEESVALEKDCDDIRKVNADLEFLIHTDSAEKSKLEEEKELTISKLSDARLQIERLATVTEEIVEIQNVMCKSREDLLKSEEGRKLAESEMGALRKQNVEKEKLTLEEETLALTEKILSLEQQKSDDEGLLTKTNEIKTKSEVELDGLYFFSSFCATATVYKIAKILILGP